MSGIIESCNHSSASICGSCEEHNHRTKLSAAKDAEIAALKSEMDMTNPKYEMHPFWEVAGPDKLREALRFQGSMTRELIPFQDEALSSRNELAAKDAEIAKLREALKDAMYLLGGPAWDCLRGEHAEIIRLREILEGE